MRALGDPGQTIHWSKRSEESRTRVRPSNDDDSQSSGLFLCRCGTNRDHVTICPKPFHLNYLDRRSASQLSYEKLTQILNRSNEDYSSRPPSVHQSTARELTPPPRTRIQTSQSEGSFTPKALKNSSKPTNSEFHGHSPGSPRLVIGHQKDQPPPRKPGQKIPPAPSQTIKQFTPEKVPQQGLHSRQVNELTPALDFSHNKFIGLR
jgi:hypothetical protein